MRKYAIVLVTIFILNFAQAQESPTLDTQFMILDGEKGFHSGDAIILGAVGFSQTTFDNYKKINIDFSPRAAYFVSNSFALGISSKISLFTFDAATDVGSDRTELSISLGPLVRFYHTPAKNFSFFGEIGFLYNTTTSNSGAVDEVDFTTNGYEISLSPGVSYFISNNFAFEASVGLFKTESVKTELDDVPSKSKYTSGFDLSNIMIGLVYKL